MSERAAPPPRWGPLTPQRWPQDENRVPSAGGLPMPPVSAANAFRARREAFTMSGVFTIQPGNAAGQVFPLYLPTDQDGDFWCDQIYLLAWFSGNPIISRQPPSLLSIADARTGRAMTWPDNVPTNFFYAAGLFFQEDPLFDPGSYPFPNGFRSTSTIAQPFCFTRSGGIDLKLTMLPATIGPDFCLIDIAFGGWKEYEAASA